MGAITRAIANNLTTGKAAGKIVQVVSANPSSYSTTLKKSLSQG